MVKKCNNNQILVKRKSNNKNTSYCKKDIGKKGKGPKTLPPISDDISLSRYGYSLSKSDKKRKTSLNKASKKHGTLTVLRRINLIRNYSKAQKKNYKVLSEDLEYTKKKYKKEKTKKKKTKKTNKRRTTKRRTTKRKTTKRKTTKRKTTKRKTTKRKTTKRRPTQKKT